MEKNKDMKTNVVWEHRSNGGRFMTPFTEGNKYEDDEHHLVVAIDVSDAEGRRLCDERRNETANAYLNSLPPELRDPKMDAEVREMMGADPIEKNMCFDADKMPDDAPEPYEFDILKNIDEDGNMLLPRHTGNTETKIVLPGAADLSDERKMESHEFVLAESVLPLTPITFSEPEDNIVFTIGEAGEMLKLCGNGDIFVKGKLVETDKEVVDGMRAMIKEFTGLK